MTKNASTAAPGTRLIILLLAISLVWMTALRFARPVVVSDSLNLARDESSRAPEPLSNYRIDLNTASRAELETLPGVGPNLADRIVANRTEHGPFRSIDDLHRIHGIGEITIDRLTPFVRIEIVETASAE